MLRKIYSFATNLCYTNKTAQKERRVDGTARNSIRKTAAVFAVLVWIGVIFSFSLHSGASSQMQSGGVIETLRALLHGMGIRVDHRIYEIYRPFLLPNEALSTAFFVRKSAHAAEYAVLGLLCAAAFRFLSSRPGRTFLFAGPLVALIDEEIIQRFLARGRTAALQDAALDTLAFYLALALCLLLARAASAARRRKARRTVRA